MMIGILTELELKKCKMYYEVFQKNSILHSIKQIFFSVYVLFTCLFSK